MEVIKVALLPAAAVLALACCAPEPGSTAAELDAPPVQLHALDDTPGCFIQPTTYFAASASAVEAMVQQMRDMRAMQASFEAQYAQLLAKAVLEEPEALSWEQRGEDHSFQGETIARGEGWGILALAMTFFGPDGETGYIGAEVHYSPASTTFAFDFADTTFSASYYQRGDLIRGCDPESGISFESGPWVLGGQLVDDVLLCWEGAPGSTSPPSDPQAQSELEMSLALRCQQAYHRLLQGTFDSLSPPPATAVLF